MEFRDVVMRRRAVRRFEEGGVGRATIDEIARLAQRTPSAGFSQGQRLVVVVDRDLRRAVARAAGEDEYDDFGPWISECAAQFIPCVSAEIYHRRYQEADKVQDDGSEIDWPVPYWYVDVGATMMVVMLAAVDAGLASGFAGAFDPDAIRALLGIPGEFVPIGVLPVGRPLPDVRSPSLKRGWVPFEEFAQFDGWS
jgi:nitroreductase